MRKVAKTLFVTLVVSCLALSSLMASPSTWAWVQGVKSSSVDSEVLPETSVEEPLKLTEESTDSKATSKKSSKVEYVVVPKDEYMAAIADIETGNAYNKKGGAQVTEATEVLVASAKPMKEKLFHTFTTIDLAQSLKEDFKLSFGLSTGFIFKDAMIASIGVMKDGGLMEGWMDKDMYTVKASLGFVF